MACPELQICAAAQQVVGWDRVAVVAADGLDHRLPLPGSDAVLTHFGDLHQSLNEGPGADVLTRGVPVLVDDLRIPVERWTLLMASVPAGFPVRSLAVLPLLSGHRHHRDSVEQRTSRSSPHAARPGPAHVDAVPGVGVVSGILVAARDSVRPFTGVEVHLLEALAAVVVLVSERRIATGDFFAPVSSSTDATPDSTLGSSPGSAATTGADAAWSKVPGEEVAVVVGMLRARSNTDEAQALAVLRGHAFSIGATIHEVARAVLAGRVSVDDLTARP